jgi:hypothetical protein
LSSTTTFLDTGIVPGDPSWKVECDGHTLGGTNKAECMEIAKKRFPNRPIEFVPIAGYEGGERPRQ